MLPNNDNKQEACREKQDHGNSNPFFLIKDTDSDEKFDNDVFFKKCAEPTLERAAELETSPIG